MASAKGTTLDLRRSPAQSAGEAAAPIHSTQSSKPTLSALRAITAIRSMETPLERRCRMSAEIASIVSPRTSGTVPARMSPARATTNGSGSSGEGDPGATSRGRSPGANRTPDRTMSTAPTSAEVAATTDDNTAPPRPSVRFHLRHCRVGHHAPVAPRTAPLQNHARPPAPTDPDGPRPMVLRPPRPGAVRRGESYGCKRDDLGPWVSAPFRRTMAPANGHAGGRRPACEHNPKERNPPDAR